MAETVQKPETEKESETAAEQAAQGQPASKPAETAAPAAEAQPESVAEAAPESVAEAAPEAPAVPELLSKMFPAVEWSSEEVVDGYMKIFEAFGKKIQGMHGAKAEADKSGATTPESAAEHASEVEGLIGQFAEQAQADRGVLEMVSGKLAEGEHWERQIVAPLKEALADAGMDLGSTEVDFDAAKLVEALSGESPTAAFEDAWVSAVEGWKSAFPAADEARLGMAKMMAKGSLEAAIGRGVGIPSDLAEAMAEHAAAAAPAAAAETATAQPAEAQAAAGPAGQVGPVMDPSWRMRDLGKIIPLLAYSCDLSGKMPYEQIAQDKEFTDMVINMIQRTGAELERSGVVPGKANGGDADALTEKIQSMIDEKSAAKFGLGPDASIVFACTLANHMLTNYGADQRSKADLLKKNEASVAGAAAKADAEGLKAKNNKPGFFARIGKKTKSPAVMFNALTSGGGMGVGMAVCGMVVAGAGGAIVAGGAGLLITGAAVLLLSPTPSDKKEKVSGPRAQKNKM